MEVHFLTKEQHKCALMFRVADVQKPILAVDVLTKAGNEVTFHKGGGTITNSKTKKKIDFKKRGGVYVLEVLIAPAREPKGNRATAPMPAGERATAPTPESKKSSSTSGFTRQGM